MFEGQRSERRAPQQGQLAQRRNTVFRQAQVLDLRNLWQLTNGRQVVLVKIQDFTSITNAHSQSRIASDCNRLQCSTSYTLNSSEIVLLSR